MNFVTFHSTKKHGNMNVQKLHYPEGMPAEERKSQMEQHKKMLAEEIGMDFRKIFLPIQKNVKSQDRYPDGHTITLTEEIVKQYEDLYDFDYYADIAKITQETPYVAVANNIADCANVIAMNLKTQEAVVAHCGGDQMNRNLPLQAIDALGGKEKDIVVEISPFAHVLTYETGQPAWLSNREVWDQSLVMQNGVLFINQYRALERQLRLRKIPDQNIIWSPLDTKTCEELYSNSNANGPLQKKSDNGRFISGVVLMPAKEYNAPYIKTYSTR